MFGSVDDAGGRLRVELSFGQAVKAGIGFAVGTGIVAVGAWFLWLATIAAIGTALSR